MHTLKYDTQARLERWLYRTEPGWLARQVASRVYAPLHARRQSRPIRLHRHDTPSIVVGSLTLGGAGKTPIAAMLVDAFARCTDRPIGLVCRGWGGRLVHARQVLSSDPMRDGDEAAMLHAHLRSGVNLWAGRSLEQARRLAHQTADIVVIDDGLETADLSRTHSIAVVDATAPRALLPAGPYRSPLSSLAHADLVWLHKASEPLAQPLPAPWMADIISEYVPMAVRLPDGSRQSPDWLRGRPVVAVCGIGRPESFLHQLRMVGAEIREGLIQGDHRAPSPRSLTGLDRDAVVVTTEKDAVRWPIDARPAVLEVGIRIIEGADRLSQWIHVLGGG